METYVNRARLAALCGAQKNRFDPPPHDVRIGRTRGWKATRVRKDGTLRRRRGRELVLLSVSEVGEALSLSGRRIKDLRTSPVSGFPPPAACIQPTPAQGQPATGGWDGHVYGWDAQAVAQFAAQTGRGQAATTGKRGRPAGSGNYASLPRCGRPLNASVHGGGRPCKAVRRKIDGQWAPACGVHLTSQERHSLGLTSPPRP